ncbi:MAG TPA: PQQ-binding-like beta-propeller repeat protein [Anaerolineales bacterium]|nr:PQQ-binding-like beta-propeller repeat protein [Anaerolineales bacterium]
MRKNFLFISMLLLSSVLLSACAGAIQGSSWPGLTAEGDIAYLASGGQVYAINLSDGREVWHYPESAGTKQVFYAAPVLTEDGLVIVGSAGTEYGLVAIDPADINPETNSPVEAWTFADATDHWVASPLVVGDKLFAPNADGNLYILDLSDGRSQKQAIEVVELAGRLWAQPVTNGELVFVTSLDHSVFAIDVETYEIVWHEDMSGAIPGSPAIGPEGMLYIGSLGSQLEQFDPQTGQHTSILDAEEWIWSTPVVDGDALYFGDLEGNFYSFNISTGELNWSVRPDGPITASAILQNDYLLLATESGNIYAIGKDGNTLWFEEVQDDSGNGKIYTTPVVASDLILVAPLETEFYLTALDTNGRTVWTFVPEN